MESKNEIKQFNKKLLIVLFMMLSIFTALLVVKAKAMFVPAEIYSPIEKERKNPTFLTYEDLIDYYDILCCQKGTKLKGEIKDYKDLRVTGSDALGAFDIYMGRSFDSEEGTPEYKVGSIIRYKILDEPINDFDKATYQHYTIGFYKIIERHIATPKEAYIIAEMKMEKALGMGPNQETSSLIIYENGQPSAYTGSLDDAVEIPLSTGESVYVVNQQYVIDTGSGSYYVSLAKDSNGNPYYVYSTDENGNLMPYEGDFSYKDPQNGEENSAVGASGQNVYYSNNGNLEVGDMVAASSGTVYLVDYSLVVNQNDNYFYAEVEGEYSYIQIAWWTTIAGTCGGTVSPVAPNSLSKEAEAFEDYILEITKKSSIYELQYELQEFAIDEGNGNVTIDSVEAPVIEYEPKFNDDADQNGIINEADEVTVSFNYLTNKYVIGPYSLDYVKEIAEIAGRNRVEFSVISDVTLLSNLGVLEFEKDWNFLFLADQARDLNEDYKYPNPNEVFYIEINYMEDLTEIENFEFEFKYMNAGAVLDIYQGFYKDVTWTAKYIDHTHEERDILGRTYTVFDYRESYLECTSVVPRDSQMLAHGLKGARWYEYTTCEKGFSINSGSITIEKRTFDDQGNFIPVNGTYYFKLFVNGMEFQELAVRTVNGYGTATSIPIVWSDDEGAPSYQVVELGITRNNGPWSGVVNDGQNIVITAENYIEANRGWLRVDKRLLNPTPAMENELFHFQVYVTGRFGYMGGPIMEYTSNNPFVQDFYLRGGQSANFGEFRWYGPAPKYRVVEIIPDGADYELVNGVINNGIGYLRNSNVPVVATATNSPTTNWTVIEVDKRFVSETAPQPGEVFRATLTVTGEFGYNGDQIRTRTETFDVDLDSSNNWKWNSAKIVWRKGNIPSYTISEYENEMPEGTKFVSISDEIRTGLINNFSSTLTPEKTLIIITNDRVNKMTGKLQINKVGETEDLFGKEFQFKVNVTGNFEYKGTKYTKDGSGYEEIVTVKIPEKTTDENEKDSLPIGEWLSDEFTWEESDGAPTYTVEEIEIPIGYSFVSISNGDKTVTSSHSISGELKGTLKKTVNDSPSKVVVTCTNKGNGKNAHIVIIKESENESIDDFIFSFRVTITGTFRYYSATESGEYTQYTNETLVLDARAVCGGEDWVSELITWNEDDPAPRYTVEEISLPANIEFVSISNREKTSSSTKIEGVVSEGTDYNYITAINKPGDKFIDGSIRISKKSSSDLQGRIFKFNLEVTGTFDYAGRHYENETYTLNNIEIEANGNPWVSGVFVWDEDGEAPEYTVTEVVDGFDTEGIKFISISNETEIGEGNSITGNLKLNEPVKIVAINYGKDQPKGSHIEITKEVLNENLKGREFYFNVKVTSTEPFRYHDLEDATKITEYPAGAVVEFNHVIVIADERDWVSGYFEWDGDVAPTYEISEITSEFPNDVFTVSIRKDTEIIVKELDNKSGEDLTITGSLVGDITHIIAVNDCNDEKPVSGKIVIEKKALSEIISGEEFNFTLTIEGKFKYNGKEYRKLEIKDIKITADGPVWTSEEIVWDERDDAPTYTVTEESATFADGVKFVSIRNAHQTNTQPAITGVVEPHFNNWVIAENTFAGYDKGRIQIHKVLLDDNGNQIDGVEFTFKVTVTYSDGTTDEKTVTVTSGGYWRSDWYVWSKKETAPTYEVVEIDNDGYRVEYKQNSGTLEALEDGKTGIVSVVATNYYQNTHQAQIRVNKNLKVNDKVSEDDVSVSFTMLVKVTGKFMYKGTAYNNETLTLKVMVSKDTNWTWLSDTFTWNGDEAPVFAVDEPSSDLPVGWHLVSTQSSSQDNTLPDGGVAVVDVTNEWKYDEELILTMKIGGKVWDDTNRAVGKPEDTRENGVIDDGEAGIENVKVTVYRALVDKSSGKVVGRLDGVFAYDENNLRTRIDPVTYTDGNGNWNFGAISVPAFTEDEFEAYGDSYCVTYDVEFEYDGQTYEPTEFLATAGGNAKSYVGADSSNNMYSDVENRWSTIINSSTSERDKYLNDSMAVDNEGERQAFNNSFSDIQGKDPIDVEGNTTGTTGSGKELNYTSVDSISFFNSDNSRKISTLVTTDEDGMIYDDLKIKACTSNADLTFPFYTQDPNYDKTAWHLRGWDKTITDVFKITYKFEAVYNYCLSINLGLVEREATDLALEKDLTEALVVVNGKALKYRFNSAIDLSDPNNKELLYKQLAVADAQVEYKLGLYKGDYYYRAEVYNGSEAGNQLAGFYNGKFGVNLDVTEMEVYLKYTINVYNQSDTYDVTVGEVADYYDDSFTLIDKQEFRYVQDVNGKEVNDQIVVGEPSSVTYYTSGNQASGTSGVTWTRGQSYSGSDGVTYNKLTTSSLAGRKLATGERASILVTFKVNRDSVDNSGLTDLIRLGDKHNTAEITKFTSYYSSKSTNRWSSPAQISGRVDEDSAPDNINITNYNEKQYYEDDTDSAPIITIGISDENRILNGIVWEDSQTRDIGSGQVVGNGLYNPEEGDKLINDLTVEIYESISIPKGDGSYEEYLFAWPKTMTVNGQTIDIPTVTGGFRQSTVTENGEYSFVNMPAGNYKVRYVYGDKEVFTGNQDSLVVYNGQDYKSTAYQIGFDNDKDGDGYVDNEWHDLSNSSLSDLRVNDARDDEARRLYISAQSEMLTNPNTTLLATADVKDADHTDLFGNYQEAKLTDPVKGSGQYMYSETAKINLGVENTYKIDNSRTENVGGVEIGLIDGKATQTGRDVGTEHITYTVGNIDCGIEERSKTKITLDKQIKQITLMTSDNKVILDAIYDISYTLKDDGSIAATVSLNEEASTNFDHITSLNRNGKNNQGYRYLIVDSEILQGTQIQVKYQFTIFNMSETDRISKDLENLWTMIDTTNIDMNTLQSEAFESALAKVSTHTYKDDTRVYEGKNVGYGTYFGSVYYLGSQGVGVRPDETIVKTKVHQMLDYIDPDVEFTDMNNISRDQSWTTTQIEYLLENKLIDPSTVQILDTDGRVTGKTANDTLADGERYSIISDKLQEYIVGSKNNIVLTMENGESQDTGSNPSFIKFLEPYRLSKNTNRSTGSMTLTVSRFYSSESDANDIDNLAEIVKFENTAGRRDARNIAGNANPYQLDGDEPIGIYAVANNGKEKDASATEVITLSPPTGLSPVESRTTQLIIVVLIAVIMVAVAIVIIKKKVLVRH